MFDTDKWQEIFSTIAQNRLRTFLTGFSVAWGIFMLIVLLGTGTGLENGVKHQFSRDAVNSLWFNAGRTAVAYRGLQPGRDIQFVNSDHDLLRKSYPRAESLTPRINLWNITEMNYGSRYGSFGVRGCNRDMILSEKIEVRSGRFINDFDVKEYRKTACVGELLVAELFREEEPVGKQLHINGV
jgi:putative ABC transport system permease protein